MTGWRGPWRAVLVTGMLVAALPACSPDPPAPPEPARPVGVALTASLPQNLSIGVVTSISSAPGEGAEWRDAAEGARVAARRFELGGATVTLVPVNDKGTAQGAAAAVSTLVDQGVAGIVMATSGDHIQAGLSKAAEAGLPVILPYAENADDLPADVWLTGPDAETVDARIVGALEQLGATRTFLVDAGGGKIIGLTPSANRGFAAGGDRAALAKALTDRLKKPDQAFDAVAVTGPAALQADVVHTLQGAGIDVPMMLTPQALSPTFAPALTRAEGTLSGEFVSVGLETGDAAALEPSAAGRALSAYFSGLQLVAADAAATDFLGDRPFSEVAGAADVRSHDAVVALVRAAAAAGSTEPAKVAQAMAGLQLDLNAGLAGPGLDFSSPTAVPDEAVVALAASPESPGLRPKAIAGSPALFWFPMPPS